MFKNYLKIAFRNLWKQRIFSIINILGLALGMACCFLIIQYVWHETNYDDFHPNGDKLYRLTYQFGDNIINRVPPALPPLIAEDFPELEAIARLYPRSLSVTVVGTENQFELDQVYFADSTTTQVLHFDFLEGNAATALAQPFSVILSEETAIQLFGTTDVIGKPLKLSNTDNFVVTAVVKNWPNNSHFDFEMFVLFENMIDVEPPHAQEVTKRVLETNKIASHSYTYAVLKENQSIEAVNERLKDFVQRRGNERFRDKQTFSFFPVPKIHLESPAGDAANVNILWLFMGIGFIILLIACINFINLSTAFSLNRAKEVGLRKVMGAQRSALIGQFLSESMVLSFLAFLLSLLLARLALPWLNNLTGLELVFAPFQNPKMLVAFISIFLLAGFLAGSYPAFFVSRFKAVTAMKGGPDSSEKPGGVTLRKGLITLQFLAAIAFISGAIIVFLQLDYIRNMPLGFKKELTLSVPIDNQNNLNAVFRPGDATVRQRMNALDEALLKNPNISAVTQCAIPPGFGVVMRNVWTDKIAREDNFFASIMAVDYDFPEFFELEVIAGREFDASHGTDHISSFVINEAAVQALEWQSPEAALEQRLVVEGKEGKVVGVVKDIHFSSLRNPINSLVLEVRPGAFSYFNIRVQNANIPETLAFIEDQWAKFFPGKYFEHAFLDESLNNLYQAEQELFRMISYFAFIAILIACFGLLGLAALSTQQRFKEIGIRKILGASIPQILNLLAKDFIILIGIAIILAIPLTWYFVSSWMENFAYSISFPWWVPFATGLCIVVLAFLTISSQAIRAALSNPIEALRYE